MEGLSIHPASLSHIDFSLQILIDVSIHTASEVDQDNLSKVRSHELDNLAQKLAEKSPWYMIQTHLCVCAPHDKLLTSHGGPYSL